MKLSCNTKVYYKNKSIGFAADLVQLVKDGKKTKTYRVGKKYSFLVPGDRIPVKDSATDRQFAEIEITSSTCTTFGALPLSLAGHEIYASREEQKEKFKTYYGRDIAEIEEVCILGFRVVKRF